MPEGPSSQGHGDRVLLPAALDQEARFKGKGVRGGLEGVPNSDPSWARQAVCLSEAWELGESLPLGSHSSLSAERWALRTTGAPWVHLYRPCAPLCFASVRSGASQALPASHRS